MTANRSCRRAFRFTYFLHFLRLIRNVGAHCVVVRVRRTITTNQIATCALPGLANFIDGHEFVFVFVLGRRNFELFASLSCQTCLYKFRLSSLADASEDTNDRSNV